MQYITKDLIYQDYIDKTLDTVDVLWVMSSVEEFLSKKLDEKINLTEKIVELINADRPKIKLHRINDDYFL
jgi:hypothetical protein